MAYRIERDFTEQRTRREFKAGQVLDKNPFDETRLAAYMARGWVVEVADEKPAAARKPRATKEGE